MKSIWTRTGAGRGTATHARDGGWQQQHTQQQQAQQEQRTYTSNTTAKKRNRELKRNREFLALGAHLPVAMPGF
jgi:hypothetical protein